MTPSSPLDAERGGNDSELESFEKFWRDHFNWLEGHGYKLRPRYHPEWVASWITTKKHPFFQEDGHMALNGRMLDALRTRDGATVMLRRADLPSVSDELKVGSISSSEPACSDPRNHCIPVYETLRIPEDPENSMVVMPFLVPWTIPRFDTFGEVVGFFGQLFEGLQFMHSLHVAHNDVKDTNIMMNWTPLYDTPPHPIIQRRKRDWTGHLKPHRRTERPVKYYFIDYDLSAQYLPEDGPALHVPGYGGDQSVPEFKKQDSCNPFAVDVYCLGNMIRKKFTTGDERNTPKLGFEFMHDLIAAMTQDDPTKRPNMDEVVARFSSIKQGLSSWKLRSRVVSKDEYYLARVFRWAFHWARQLIYISKRIPAIPLPSD